MKKSDLLFSNGAGSNGRSAGARRKFGAKPRIALAVAVGVAGLLTTRSAMAATPDDYWTGGTTPADFYTNSDWGLTVPPTVTNPIANADNGGGGFVGGTILFSASDAAATVFDIHAGDDANDTSAVWLQSGSTMTSNSWFRLAIGTGAVGTYNMTGGTFINHGHMNIGENGTGILLVSGNSVLTSDGSQNGAFWALGVNTGATGIMNVSGSAIVNDSAANDGAPFQVASASGSTGFLSLNGSATINTNSNELWIGENGNGTMNMSGGTLNVGNWLVVGRGSGTGVLNLTGGIVNETGANHYTMAGASGTVNQTGGVMNVNNNVMWIGEGTTATYNLGGSGVLNAGDGVLVENDNNGNGTFNLNTGGTLNAQWVSSNATSGSRVFNFNGGLVVAGGAGPNGLFLSNLSSANVLAGGAYINLNGNSTTFATPLTTGTAAGVTDGGLHVTGNGGETLTMLGNSTFSGQAIFSNGVNLTLGNGSSTGSLLGAGGVNMNTGNLTISSQAGGGNAIAGPISGSGSIYVNNGLLQLGSTNSTYTGTVYVAQSGGIILGTGGTTGALSVSGMLNFQNGATFGYNQSGAVTFPGLPGVSNFVLEQAGTGVLNVGAGNNASSFTITNGVLNVTDPTALNTVSAININYPGALAVPGSLESQPTLALFNTGSGGILALTTATSNPLDFSTNSNVRLGAFVAGANGLPSATSSVVYTGTVNPGPTFANASSTTVTANTVVLGGGGSILNYASPITDGGTYAGTPDTAPTSIDINFGTVQLTNAGNTFTGNITVQPNGTMLVPAAVAGTFGNAASLLLRGGVVMYPANDPTPADITTQTRASNGTVIPAYIAAGYAAIINTNGNNVTFAGPIGGAPANASSTVLTNAGSFSKQGLGTLTDSSSITATTFFVNGGTVAFTGNGSGATLNNYSSIGQNAGDNGSLSLDNGAKLTTPSDFNVADVSGASLANTDYGTFNISNTAFATNPSAPVTTLKSNTVYVGKGFGGQPFATGVANQGPGTLVQTNGNFQVGQYGTGTYNQTGGSVVVGSYLSIGRYSSGVGIYNMTGGTITANPSMIVGEDGSGTLVVSGGSTITTPLLQLALGTDNVGATGTINQNGGTITATNGVRFGANVPVGSTSTYTGVYNLNGGTLITPGFSTNMSAPGINSTLNFNGTQIVASNNSGAFLGGITNANVLANGAVFNTAGYTLTISKSLTSGTAVGTPDGGLNKSGTGTLVLSSTQGYTGTTNITGGTLRLQGVTVPVQTGLVAWYDPSDPAALVTGSNGSVTAFLNKGQAGFALNAVASNSAAEATVTPLGAPNGVATNVTLNGTAAYNTASNDPVSGNASRTLFVVGSRGTNASAFLANQGTLSTNNAYGISVETGNTYLYTYNNDITVGIQSPNQTVIADSTLNNSGATLTGDLIQATISGQVSTMSKTIAANTAVSPLQIAGRSGGNSTGTLDAVLEYNVALTTAQTQAVEQYLEEQYFAGYGSVPLQANILPVTTTVNLSNTGSTLDLNGDNQQVAGLTGTAGTFVTTESGTLTVANTVPNVYGGIITAGVTGGLTVSGGSGLSVGSGTSVAIQVQSLGNLNIGAGSTLALTIASNHSGRQLVQATSLSISPTGSLNLGNGDLDLNSSSTSLSAVTQLVAAGYNLTGGANWKGVGGINSSAAAANPGLMALGVVQNNQNGTPLFGLDSPSQTQFDGTNPGDSDILVKYTYFGDANLDGKVDGSDYSLIDNGYANHLTGWYNGDFNYDGVIDGSDYALIDNAFNNQGAQLTSPTALVASATAQVAGPTAVPEPASIALIAAGAVGLLARRRRA